jgi:hypothetical protein
MTVSEVKFEITMRIFKENSESGISPLLRGVPDRIFGRKHGTAIWTGPCSVIVTKEKKPGVNIHSRCWMRISDPFKLTPTWFALDFSVWLPELPVG